MTWNATSGLSSGIVFLLSDVSYPKNYWDYYKISKVVVQLWPEFNNVPINADRDKVLYGSTAVDYDDATMATSTADPFKDYSSRKMFISNRTHIRIFTPRPNIEIYKSSASTNYGFLNIRSGAWINTVHDGVPHYGLKIWLPSNTGAPSAIGYKLIIKYYVLFRNRI
ncbi:putative capsid protein [Barbel circovirus]|uniref:Putative capsid protein n=1 Tax=Barbel circovirus TaxID=759938 RepID=F4YBZ8_9CIRC|nr:putative capsid protein [Barbel circovirus]ADG27891.1 putative capsid protein [Barbel circovirus]